MKRGFKIRGDLIFLLCIMAFGVFVLVCTTLLYGGESYEAKGFPMYASILLLVACAVKLVSLLRESARGGEGREAGVPEQESTEKSGRVLPAIVQNFLWVAFIPVTFILLGMDISFPLFELCFLRAHKVGWRTAVLFAVADFLVINFGFGVFLQIRFYEGLLFGGVF